MDWLCRTARPRAPHQQRQARPPTHAAPRPLGLYLLTHTAHDKHCRALTDNHVWLCRPARPRTLPQRRQAQPLHQRSPPSPGLLGRQRSQAGLLWARSHLGKALRLLVINQEQAAREACQASVSSGVVGFLACTLTSVSAACLLRPCTRQQANEHKRPGRRAEHAAHPAGVPDVSQFRCAEHAARHFGRLCNTAGFCSWQHALCGSLC